MKKYFILFLAILSCNTPGKKETTQTTPRLTMEEAQWRKSKLSSIRYETLISLYEKSKSYSGSVTLFFKLVDNQRDIPLDFREGKVKRLFINKIEVKNVIHQGGKIILTKDLLKPGENKIAVDFDQNYSNSGVGLHKFVDPIDQNEYSYTQLEAYDGNRFFPMFDQPDLKSTFSLTVTAPKDWEVVSTSKVRETLKDTNVRRRWIFETSPRMSSYLLSLIAGPYFVWKSQYKDIPLRLLARKTLKQYVPSTELFQLTQNGFAFYEKYFNYPYPFKKYDQIFVPEFSSEAMENIAAVTFTEDYIKRGKATRDERLLVANTLLHEMAHMWFGNLVTMKWWNDLWLNESFASYMASLALAKSTQFEEAWLDFHDFKQWAYKEDQLITTHPIEAHIPSTEEAFSNFDGITYAKGASVLKQLAYYIGEEHFQKGVQKYFKKHEYENTDLNDFISALSEASKKNLQYWSELWLRQSGIDRISAKLNCDGDKLEDISLTIESDQTLKPHKVQVGFIYGDPKNLRVTKTRDVLLSEAKTTIKEDGPCPQLVYANLNDYDYVKVILDSDAVQILKNGIGGIQDDQLRLMLWNDLWAMVLDQKLSLAEYTEITKQNWDNEKNQKILNQIARTMVDSSSSVVFFWPASTPAEIEKRSELVRSLENQIFANLQKSKSVDLKLYWFDTFVRSVETLEGQQKLAEILTGKMFTLDIDRQWSAYLKLCIYNWEGIPTIERKLLAIDASDRAKNGVLGCKVARPLVDNKKDFFKKIVNESDRYSMDELKSILAMIFPRTQEKFKSDFKTDIYSFIRERIQKKDEEYQARVAATLAPTLCNRETNKELKSFIDSNSTLSPIVSRELKIAWQEDERCVKIGEATRARP